LLEKQAKAFGIAQDWLSVALEAIAQEPLPDVRKQAETVKVFRELPAGKGIQLFC
jgi:hypothetical protein